MPQEITSAVLTTLFNKNQLVFVINGPWFSAEINKNIDYAIAPIPNISENIKAKPYISNEGIFINKYSDKKSKAIKFIRFLSGLKGGKIRMDIAEQTVSVVSLYNNKKKFEAFKLQAQSSEPISNSPTMNYFWAPMNQVLKKVLQQNVKPKKALKEAEIKIKNLLSK
jgi:maltose-binding protein MalE